MRPVDVRTLVLIAPPLVAYAGDLRRSALEPLRPWLACDRVLADSKAGLGLKGVAANKLEELGERPEVSFPIGEETFSAACKAIGAVPNDSCAAALMDLASEILDGVNGDADQLPEAVRDAIGSFAVVMKRDKAREKAREEGERVKKKEARDRRSRPAKALEKRKDRGKKRRAERAAASKVKRSKAPAEPVVSG